MKRKYCAYATIIPVLMFSLMGAGVASAHGWFWNATPEAIATQQQIMFESKAKLLGISVDEIKTAWAEGKTLLEIATEHGITEADLQTRMMNAKKDQMKQQLQTLVDKGIITQAQADRRFSVMSQRFNSVMGKGMGRHMHGRFGFWLTN